MDEGRRIAMWSGPRNLSTALMRAFGNRADIHAVHDEPFYAAYLAATGRDHPMRAEILANQPQDWRVVAATCAGEPVPPGRLIYQKHMTQHMLPGFGRDWMDVLSHAFLIRTPERVVASFAAKMEAVGLEDIGFVQQGELFDRIADRTGIAPPVVEAEAIRAAPEPMLRALCTALGIPFDAGMLAWAPGARASDGVWGAHWYAAVNLSTGFTPPDPPPAALPAGMQALADAARPAYERLRAFALQPDRSPP